MKSANFAFLPQELANIKVLAGYRRMCHFCPVHLPGQNIFCPIQNQICPRQNNFVNDKIFICPVHLPRQNIFCPGQNQICPRQNNFVNDRIFLVHKNFFVHSLKIISALRKLGWSHGQNFCHGQKILCHWQNYFV